MGSNYLTSLFNANKLFGILQIKTEALNVKHVQGNFLSDINGSSDTETKWLH